MAAFVTGGCGFVGHHLVKALLQSKEYTAVHVISRDPKKNLVDGAEYHKGDFGSKTIGKLFESIGPIKVVFHVASPKSTGNNGTLQSYLRPNVEGTQNLMDCARAHGVQAFVFTSSTSVYLPDKNGDLIDVPEDARTITLKDSADFYSKSKAEADRCVLAANGEMKTVSLRITNAYGERDEQTVAVAYGNRSKWRSQIGDNKSMWDHVSAENCCALHLQAARALLQNTPGVAGEAFNVTDGVRMPFWTFLRLVWKAAGEDVREEQIRVIPVGLMLALATIVEWIFWIFTFGRRTPKTFRKHNFRFMAVARTFSIEKAKKLLDYAPKDNTEDVLKAAVRYIEEQNGNKAHKES